MKRRLKLSTVLDFWEIRILAFLLQINGLGVDAVRPSCGNGLPSDLKSRNKLYERIDVRWFNEGFGFGLIKENALKRFYGAGIYLLSLPGEAFDLSQETKDKLR